MRVPFFTPTRQYNNKKEQFDNAIQKVLNKGDFILGNAVSNFEENIKNYTGAKYAVGVASGSDALILGADILGFKEGKYVITTSFTFFASVSCIVKNGATPVFVDIDEKTCQIDVKKAEEAITHLLEKGVSQDDIVGVIPVHLFNQISDMDALMELAGKYNLRVLEDAAEAFGMKYNYKGEMRHAGTIGDMGIYSFFPTKTLGGYGDGGLIVTNDEDLYKKIKAYRVHGTNKKYHHKWVGYNSRLDTIQAAILDIKLEDIEDAIQKRNKIAQRYIDNLSSNSNIELFDVEMDKHRNLYYVFNIRTSKRNELHAYLKENEIGTSIYYPVPLHLQECFEYLGYKKGDFPVSEKMSNDILALPIFPELTMEEVDFACEKINEFYA